MVSVQMIRYRATLFTGNPLSSKSDNKPIRERMLPLSGPHIAFPSIYDQLNMWTIPHLSSRVHIESSSKHSVPPFVCSSAPHPPPSLPPSPSTAYAPLDLQGIYPQLTFYSIFWQFLWRDVALWIGLPSLSTLPTVTRSRSTIRFPEHFHSLTPAFPGSWDGFQLRDGRRFYVAQ